jgi:hypothetical protein
LKQFCKESQISFHQGAVIVPKRNERTILMKKSVFALLLIFALMLTACNGVKPNSNSENGTSTHDTRPVITNQTSLAHLEDAQMLTDVDGMMGRGTAWAENGMYQLVTWGVEGGANITFFDYQTHTRSYLCSLPDCTHNDESCPCWFSPEAYAGGAGLFTDGKYLYFLRLGTGVEAGRPETITDTSSSVITRMNFDGTGREVIAELSSAEFIWGALAKSQDSFYFLRDSFEERDGSTISLRQMVSYDINTQEITPIQEFDQDTYFVGVCNAGFVMKSLVDQRDNSTVQTVWLYRLATGEIEMVKEWNGMNIVAQVANGNLYYVDAHSAEFGAIDLDTKETTILSNTLPLHDDDEIQRLGIFDGRFMFMVYEHGNHTLNDIKYYSVALDNGSIYQNTLNFTAFNITSPVYILAENSTHFLVLYDKRGITIPTAGPDGTPTEFETEEELIGLMSKEDFWNNNPVYVPIENVGNFMYR